MLSLKKPWMPPPTLKPKSLVVEIVEEVSAVDLCPDEADATRAVWPDARAGLTANRCADQHVGHQGRDVAIPELEVARSDRVFEEVRRPTEVSLEPDNTVAHPAQRCAEVEAALELVVEVVELAEAGVAAEIGAQKRRKQPVC